MAKAIDYNRGVTLRLVALAAAVWLAGCAKNIQTTDAVRDGVLKYLKTRADIDTSRMSIDVSNVSFRKGEADATVVFLAKGSTDAKDGMRINYTLERQGDEWVVKGRRATTPNDPHGQPTNPHGGK